MNPVLQRAMSDLRAGLVDRALDSLRVHLRLHPRDPDGHGIHGMVLLHAGRPDDAIRAFERAVALSPHSGACRANLATSLQLVGRNEESRAMYDSALSADPSSVAAWQGLARVCVLLEDWSAALVACDRGIALQPASPELLIVRSAALEASGRLEEAIDCIARAVETGSSDQRLRGRLLYLLNFTERSAESIASAHRRYGSAHGRAMAAAVTDGDPHRRLRIGVLSGELRTHAVGHFARALFSCARPDADLVVFSTHPPRPSGVCGAQRPADPMEAWFRQACDGWVECHSMDDLSLDQAIRQRQIDVLLDLSGHVDEGRQSALALRPAPVCVTGIGYPNTTGNPAVDWRLVDSITDPPGSEHLGTERPLRIDPCFLCYSPPEGCPDPEMPADWRPLSFGSFNLASKISDRTVRLWARVLASEPTSELVLKSKWLAGPLPSSRLLKRFEDAGVDPSRIRILGYAPSAAEHLRSYREIDVALDTFPYNGTTTTCEALWMGVPVVTMMGDRHCARVGASLLSAAGLNDLVAPDEDSFVRTVQRLGGDTDFRVGFRSEARRLLGRSALLAYEAYGQRVLAALRGCWQDRCGMRE